MTAIAQIDAAESGTMIALAPAQFAVDIDSEARGWVHVSCASTRVIQVSYSAGLATSWDTLPEVIRHAVIRLVAYLYNSRDSAADVGPPAVVAALLRPYRRMRLS